MKKTFTLLIGIIFSTAFLYTQVPGSPPEGFSYKATIIKANGAIVANKTISLRISILQGSTNGTPVHTEVFHPKTSEYGQIDIIIGANGLPFIPWNQGPFYLKTEFDEKGGTNFLTLPITQLLSVPYALYSGSATTANETDPIFKSHPAFDYSPDLLINGNTAYSWGNHSLVGYATINGIQTLTNKTLTSPVINSPIGLLKADVGLGEVDNTRDLLKPISTPTQTALNLKENLLSFYVPLNRVGNVISLPPASSISGGYMSGADKVKLDGLQNANGSETKITSGNNISVSGNGTLEVPYSINSTVPIINGNNKGDMQYWDGSKWIIIPVGSNGQVLTLVNGIPTWSSATPSGILPVVTTTAIGNITQNSATSGGNVTNDGGSGIIARGVCWGADPNPTVNLTTKTNDGTGTGVFSSNVSGLTSGTSYHVRAYATNSIGTNYGEDLSFNTLPVLVTGTVSDNDNHNYKTVKIGDKWWMAENLKTTKYNDGSSIPTVQNQAQWGAVTPLYSWNCQGEETEIKSTYGLLYNWYAVSTGKLCPDGWHVSTREDFWALLSYFDPQLPGSAQYYAGDKLKEAGTSHWNSPNTGATNETGFTALPGGLLQINSGCAELGSHGYWWFSDIGEGNFTTAIEMYFNNSYVGMDISRPKNNGFSVRCVKNDEITSTDNDSDGYTVTQGDCDDNNSAIHPGATEICGDGIDQDCNESDLDCTWQTGMLNSHNYYRAEVKVPSVKWSEQLAQQAQTWAEHLASIDQIVHSQPQGYMENIAMAGGTTELTTEAVVSMWGSEKDIFNPLTGDCEGYDVSYSCAHYKIIVGYSVTDIGCGKSVSSATGRWYYVCRYTPLYNFSGRPYPDADGDAITDNADNCPNIPNNDQADNDGDGVGNVCDDNLADVDGDGYTVATGDCNDNNPTIHPGATEICGDGIDQDCNGNDSECNSYSSTCLPSSEDPIPAMIRLLNSKRIELGLVPLAPDPRLAEAAQGQADYCASTDIFSHVGAGGSDFNSRCEDAGYFGLPTSEVGAMDSNNPATVLDMWLTSTVGHREIVLGNYKHMGIGLAQSSNLHYYWFIDFGSATVGPTCTSTEDDIDHDGYTLAEGDCDDNNSAIHPGATEICGDGIDQDCNGSDQHCPENLLKNSSFEDDPNLSWVDKASLNIISTQNYGVIPHDGNYYAGFGGTDNFVGDLTQEINIPVGASSLRFNFWVLTLLPYGNLNYLAFYIDDQLLFKINPTENYNIWQKQSFEIPLNYSDGKTHKVKIEALNIGFPTRHFVDSVELIFSY